MASGIYAIRHVASGRRYIGSARNIARRWSDHRRGLDLRAHPNRRLNGAWQKYGPSAFAWDVIEHVEVASLLEREQYWIDRLETCGVAGFNLRPRAASNLGAKFAPRDAASRAKSAAAASRRGPPSEAALANRAAALRRPEIRAKISAALKGRMVSDEQRQKLSVARRGKKPVPMSAAGKASMIAKLRSWWAGEDGRAAAARARDRMRVFYESEAGKAIAAANGEREQRKWKSLREFGAISWG